MFRERNLFGRVIPVFLLVLLDQLVKSYIAQHMMDIHFKIFGNFLDFKPHLNTSYSWVNDVTNMGIGRTVHILTVLALFALTCIIYDFIRINYSLKAYEHCLFTLLFAAMVCSFLDKVFWGGSLDFIWLKGFFIFDLKDAYLTGAEILLIIKFLLSKELRNFKTIEVLPVFREYLRVRFGVALKKK